MPRPTKRRTDSDLWSLVEELKQHSDQRQAAMMDQLQTLKDEVKDLHKEVTTRYVTRERLQPIKAVVFGVLALILLSVVGSVLKLVLVP